MALGNMTRRMRRRSTNIMDALEEGIKACNEKERKKGLFRISAIGQCLRSTYYEMFHPVQFSMKTLMKMNLGTAIHEMYQKYMTKQGIIYGFFQCKSCGVVGSFGFPPEKCPGCGHERVRYTELDFFHPTLKVRGHPDGFIGDDNEVEMWEVKSISPNYKIGTKDVDYVKKNLGHQIRQANFYLGIVKDPETQMLLRIGDDQDKNVDKDHQKLLKRLRKDRFQMVYHDKGTDVPVVFPVAYEQQMFDIDKARVKTFWACVEKGEIPPREVSSNRCKWCDYMQRCNEAAFQE